MVDFNEFFGQSRGKKSGPFSGKLESGFPYGFEDDFHEYLGGTLNPQDKPPEEAHTASVEFAMGRYALLFRHYQISVLQKYADAKKDLPDNWVSISRQLSFAYLIQSVFHAKTINGWVDDTRMTGKARRLYQVARFALA